MRILHIEDDFVVIRLVGSALKQYGFAVDHANTAADAVAALSVITYDAIILDLALPDLDGLALLRKIRARNNSTPLLILSARRQTAERVAGLEAGADDYLPKPFDISELVARLHAVTRRPSRLLNPELRCGNLTFVSAKHLAFVNETPLQLPRREASVLEHLLRNVGRPIAKSTLEDRLYAFGKEVASNSVEVHIHHLRRRLLAADATVRIETRRGIGYALVLYAPASRPASGKQQRPNDGVERNRSAGG